MRTNSTLKEVWKFIECCKYIFPFQKSIQQVILSKISLKSLLILILGFGLNSSTLFAQELPVRIGNTLSAGKTTSKTTAKTAAVNALAAAAGSIDVANASAGYNNYTADQLVRNVLTSGCLTIGNVRFGYYRRNNNNWSWVNHSWSGTAGDRQLGYYSKGTSTFPIDEGLLLSTGKISSAMGPNNFTDRSDGMVNEASDPDLTTISGKTMHDASILEFDFIPDGNLVEFKFVFASEEYLEYVHTDYNDAFGFFLSGFGITGTYTNNAINLAQLPNGDAVTINNIHSSGTNVNNVTFPNHNVSYYSNNPAGSATMEYDGSTVVLTATYAVTPGKNYKIKMAIADASDQKWDAGVFLKARSFATNTLVITNPAPVCLNGTANITLPAITAGSTSGLTYTYWKDAAATIPFTTPTAAAVGTYYIKGQNTQSGCSDIKPVVVSQTIIVVTETTASHVDVKCNGSATGAATVTASGGTAPYTYSWNTNPIQTTATATGLTAGTYTVTVTDSKGCSGTQTVTITQPTSALNIAVTSKTDINCFNATTGAIDLTISGGTAAYTYAWKKDGSAIANTTQDLTAIGAGVYEVTVTDSKGCSAVQTITITQPTAALSIAVTSKTDINCFNATTGAIDLTISGGTAAYTYAWKKDGSAIAATTQDLTAIGAGVYEVTVTDSKGCTAVQTITITQPTAALNIAVTSKTDINCFNATTGAIDLTISGGTAAYTYAWKKDGSSITATTQDLNAIGAGVYEVTITDSKGCTAVQTITIAQPTAALNIVVTSKTDINCFNATTGAIDLTISGGTAAYTYAWKKDGSAIAATTQDLTAIGAGVYEVTVTDSKGCSAVQTITITQPTAALSIAVTSKTDINCFNATTGAIDLTISGGTAAYTYAWKKDGSTIAATTQDLTAIGAGVYQVTVTDSKGCTAVQTITITITQPTAALSIAVTSKTDVNCFSATTGAIDLTISGGTADYTYAWKKDGSTIAATTQDLTAIGAGVYEVTLTDSKGCSAVQTITITQPTAALSIAVTSKTDINCFNATTGAIDLTISGGSAAYTYAWKKDGSAIANTTQDLTAIGAGVYEVTVTDSKGCSAVQNITIAQPTAALSIAVTSKTDINCFNATTGAIDLTISGGTAAYTYAWKKDGSTIANNTQDLTAIGAGVYQVTVTDSKGCTAVQTITITQPTAALSIAVTSKTDINCFNATTGAIDLTISGGTAAYTYAWKKDGSTIAATTQDLTAIGAGVYEVTVTDSKGCTAVQTITIAQPTAALSCSITQSKPVSSNGLSDGEATVHVLGGTTNYTYKWDNNETTQTAIALNAGLHSVTVTDAKGCTTTCSVNITEPNVLSCSISQNAAVKCFGGSDGKATVIPVGGNGDYTYLWDNNETTAQAIGLSAGLHTVKVTDKLGYTTTCTVQIGQPQGALKVTLTQIDVACGGGSTGSANAVVSGGTPQYTYSWNTTPIQTTATATGLIAGTYTVTITDANSCSISQSVTINDGDSVKPVINPLPVTSTINCPALPVFAVATATDNNGTIASLTYEDVTTKGACAGSYTITRTWKAVDACGNISLPVSQVIIVQDISKPTWSTQIASLNKTIECSDAAALTSAQALFPTATDSCDSDVSNIVKVSGAFVASTTCSNAGTYTNTWTVKDDCGNVSDTFTQIITIQDSSKPTWATQTASLNKTIECSDAAALTSAQALFPTATDSCDIDVSNIVKVSGAFVASATCSNAGTYTNIWTVKDDCGNVSDTFTQVITIQDSAKPTWTTQSASLNKTIECSDAAALTSAQALFPTATDSCDNDVSNIVKVSGAFVASATCSNAGTYTNTWTVKDDCGNVSDTFTQVITIQDSAKPTWSTQIASLNKTIECSDATALTAAQALFPTATDSCDSDVSNIVKVSGAFVASATCSNAGTYTNTWTVKDDCGNISDTFTQVITIQDSAKPTWSTQTASLNKTIECSDAAALTSAQALFPTATDSCDNDVSNIVKVSGAFVASATCSNAGTYTNTWTVKDDCGNISDTFTQIITIQDSAKPAWSTQISSLNKTVECSDAAALTSAQALFPTATDSCDNDVSNIVKVSGVFVASATCSNAGTYTNTWTVKDDCGNVSDTFTQVITIQDTSKPVFAGELPSDSTVSCDAVPAPATMQATDNCNGDLPIVFSETKSNIDSTCASNYTLTRKWLTSDCGGNVTTFTQIITVRDTTAPKGTAPADVANLQSIADIPVGNPSDIKDATDNCSSTVNITVSDSNNEGSGCNGNPYILTRIYTLTDCAGNKTELKQTFTVENKVSVTGIATNTTCFGGKDGSILVTNSAGSTVIIRNENNEVVGNTNLPAGTYTLTATSSVNSGNQTCTATATVVIGQPAYTVKISGQVINKDTNTPLANVPVTLVPQGTTAGPVLLRITGADGLYNFSGMVAGSYLVQVQDANLNSAYQLYPIDSSLFFTTLEDCKIQVHNFEYGASTLPVLGDYVWYDTNSNGVQDEWYDANNDGIVTKNIPDANGAIDYSQWEWIDLNGDGSYKGPQNVGELNAGGFGNALSANVIIDGPNGYHEEVIVGLEGFWRNRPETANPYGAYTIKLVKDANFDAVAASLGATGLVKVLPSVTNKKVTAKTGKSQLHTVCSTTGGANGYIVNVTPQDLVHLDADFGVNCKVYSDIVANDDTAGPIAGINTTITNVVNVLQNDTLEGIVVKPSDVILTTVTGNPFLQLNANGSVDVLPNAPVGTLTLVYQICEADQTSNCDTATVSVIIEAPVMTVTATAICVNDVPYVDYVVTPKNFTPVNGVTIAWANNSNTTITTMTNLPLSGRVLWPGALVDGSGKGIDWPGWIFENNKWIQGADGFETLRPSVKLTISVNPSETITINYPPSEPYCTARPTFAIVANDDNLGPIIANNGQTNVVNVLTNDSLNNTAINLADVTLTVVTPDPKGALTLNPDGSIDIKANTPAGTYTLTYQICEKADFGNCDTAIVTIVVADPPAPPTPVVANDDTYNNIGCNTFGLVGNVLSNDFKGITPATLTLVNFTLLSPNNNAAKTDPNITIDTSGNLTVSSLTPAGTYTYSYQICDKLSAENCDTATVTITVVPNGVTTVSSAACNDDSTLINLLSLLPENTPANGTWIDAANTNTIQGNSFNALGLSLGNYVFEYKITDQSCPRSIILNMEINDDCKVLACGNIVVHNAFSPNGDGINDVFKIDSIDDITCYPENNVEIYNRWGILVFETTNYNNTNNAFDGTSRGRTTVQKSDGLPPGTYFYIITYKSVDGNNVIQNNKKDGYLYLSK